MTTYTPSHRPLILGQSRRPSTALSRLSAEAKAFAAAIISPNRIIGEVEQMVALQREATRIAPRHPQQALELRRRAARIGR